MARIEWHDEQLRDLFKHDAAIGDELMRRAREHCDACNSWTMPWLHGDMRTEPFTVDHRVLDNTQVAVIRPQTRAGYGMAVKRGALHW